MKKSLVFGLIAITLFSILIRTLPLFRYTMWGIDCGEYIFYTKQLIDQESIYLNIEGWGNAYTYFPCMYLLAGSFHLMTNIDIISSTVFTTPLLSSFVPLLAFVLVHKLSRNFKGAILTSIFLSILAPFVYNYSQPKPETIGFVLMLSILVMSFMISKKNKKILLLIIFPSMALIVTHHLSSYFLILFMIGGISFSIIFRRKYLNKDFIRLVYLLFFLTFTIGYWIFFAEPFRENRILNALGFPSYSILLLPYLFIILIFIIKKVNRHYNIRFHINLIKEDMKSFKTLAIIVVFLITIGLLFSGFVNIPGRESSLGFIVIFYIPLSFLFIFCIAARKIIGVYSEGVSIYGWVVFGGLSLIAGIITTSTSLLPMRQVSFLIFVMSIFFGLGVLHAHKMINPYFNHKKVFILFFIVALLLVSSVPLTYPSQEMLNGYQEGTEWKVIESGYWSHQLKGKIGTDHRISASIFAVSNKNLSWHEGDEIYFSSEYSLAKDEIKALNIRYILIETYMRNGVLTRPGVQPDPIDENLLKNYQENNYCIYSNNEVNLYYIL